MPVDILHLAAPCRNVPVTFTLALIISMAGIYREDRWALGQAYVDGRPIVVRSRSALPAIPDRSIYAHLIVITWPYEGNEHALPAPELNRMMQSVEEAIDAAIDPKGVGAQAACITGNGQKEWRYYSYDRVEFMERLNIGLAGQPPYPLEFRSFEDPEWNALAELLPIENGRSGK